MFYSSPAEDECPCPPWPLGTARGLASPGHSVEGLQMEEFSGESQNGWCQLGTQDRGQGH